MVALTIIPDTITNRLIGKITAKAIRASSYERMSKRVEPWASVKFTLFTKANSWSIVNYNKTWKKKRRSLIGDIWLRHLQWARWQLWSLVHKLCEILHSFAPDLRQSFSKLSSLNDWSYLGEDAANDISRKCSFCSSQISFSLQLCLLVSLDIIDKVGALLTHYSA